MRFGRLGLLVIVSVGLLGAPDGVAPASPSAEPQEATVVGLLIDEQTQQPTIVLQGKRDRRTFAMVIGPAEAAGIAFPLQHLTPPRPLTHDLFLTVFGRLHVKVTKVVINDLRNNTFYARLFLATDDTVLELDSRPSDAIALAIRAKAPILVEDRVFDRAERLPAAPSDSDSRI
jgi:bifunctional DNase/RNase